MGEPEEGVDCLVAIASKMKHSLLEGEGRLKGLRKLGKLIRFRKAPRITRLTKTQAI